MEWKSSIRRRRKEVSIFRFKLEFLSSSSSFFFCFQFDRISIKPISLSATRLNLIRRAIYFNEQSNAIVNSRLLHGPRRRRPSRSVVLKSPTLVFPLFPTLLLLLSFYFFFSINVIVYFRKWSFDDARKRARGIVKTFVDRSHRKILMRCNFVTFSRFL